MRIVSDYHDFYDGVMAMDHERELVYRRKIEEVEPSKYPFPNYPSCPVTSYMRYGTWSFQVFERLIGFCGKVYPVLQLATNRTRDLIFAYNVDDVDEFVLNNFDEREVDAFFDKDESRHWPRNERHEKFVQFFDEAKRVEGQYPDLFQEYKVPIWVYDFSKKRNRLILNAPLKQIGFYKIMDAYTAYQEISMFYGGLALPLKPIPEMSDDIKAEASGHGGKYSFRQPPKDS